MVRAGELLAAARAAHGREPRLGCQLAAHRDLGFCAACHPDGGDGELQGWRLLALAERGIPDQP